MVKSLPTIGRKMPQCAFKNCKNNHRNTKVLEGISFFRFPSDPFCCAEWVSIVARERGEEIYNPYKNSRICSNHFDKCDMIGNTQRRRLLKTAVPKLQIQGPLEVHSAIISSELTKDLSNQVKSSTLSFKDNTGIHDVSRADAVNLLKHVSISDLIPYCDTPIKGYLEKKLTTFRRIIDTKSKIIRNLHKVNKRLTKKNCYLKNIIHLLRKKQSIDDFDQ